MPRTSQKTRSSETLRSMNPMTGEVIGEIRANSAEEAREAVARARKVAPEWAATPIRERVRFLGEVRRVIYERMDDIVDVVSTENGKPAAEALAHDVLPSLLTLRYMEAIAPSALRPEKVGRFVGPLLGFSSRIEWRPFGVVGAIAPWNYPFFLAFVGLTPALVAGNAVVLKPSEMTPGVGEILREVLEPLPADVAIVVQGGGEVGGAIVDAPVDKLCFIGSTATGRKIAEAAAKHLTPLVMELGGQDATIVCEDADLDVAAAGVLWGAFMNAGQTCASIERAYVVDSVADRFEERLVSKLGEVTANEHRADIGPLTVQRQLETVERHVSDAVEKGAKVLAGGQTPTADGKGKKAAAQKRKGLWFAPTVLEGRSEDMALFKEETFGPVLPIARVRDTEEAIRRANEDGFNLTASVWTRSPERGRQIASRLRAGTVTINDHGATAGAPWGTWGGVGESGYGRVLGKLGIREFTVPVHVARSLTPGVKRLWWYPYDQPTTETLRAFAEVVGADTWSQRASAFRKIAGNALQAIRNKL